MRIVLGVAAAAALALSATTAASRGVAHANANPMSSNRAWLNLAIDPMVVASIGRVRLAQSRLGGEHLEGRIELGRSPRGLERRVQLSAEHVIRHDAGAEHSTDDRDAGKEREAEHEQRDPGTEHEQPHEQRGTSIPGGKRVNGHAEYWRAANPQERNPGLKRRSCSGATSATPCVLCRRKGQAA